MQTISVIVRERLVSLEAMRQLLAELRIDPGKVLVPEGETHRMKAGGLLSHKGETQAQELGTVFPGFAIAHG
jgi:hypothetical protein